MNNNGTATLQDKPAAPATELRNLISDIEELLKNAVSEGHADAATLRSRLQEQLNRAGSVVAGSGRRITQAARSTAGAADHYVHESPWQAVGIAALGGALIGFLWSRR